MAKILITGVLGYVGRQLCEFYKNSNHKIVGIDNNFIPDKVAWLVKNNIKFYQRDLFNISDLLNDCDICYHLAGVTDVNLTQSTATPEKDAFIIKTGTEGTRFIIQNINKKAKLIFASTQVVYDGLKEEKFNITEDIDPCPSVSYSQSKRQSEIDLLNSDINFLIVRFASVYGYNHCVRYKILPNLFSKMTAFNQNLKVFGAENYKPLVGIKDLARCLDFLVKNNYNKEIFHCCNENLKVIEIANICKKINPNININIVNEETPNKGFTLSNQKLLNEGFKFNQNIETEMKKMIKIWRNK